MNYILRELQNTIKELETRLSVAEDMIAWNAAYIEELQQKQSLMEQAVLSPLIGMDDEDY